MIDNETDTRTLLYADQRTPVDWWVVFTDPGEGHWWDRFLRPGWRHVYALGWTGDHWVGFFPDRAGTYVGTLRAEHAPILAVARAESTAIIRVVSDYDAHRWRAPWVLAPWTCVEQVKALIGLRDPRILTPYQLYKRLIMRQSDEIRG